MVAASGVLADLVVSALMGTVSALVNVCNRPQETNMHHLINHNMLIKKMQETAFN